ncbi:MFS transporter [Nonomuraea sp. NPDC050783]|uniref:MFS transporter n=1 Tax=Nonomuraea sp. NPDC050783 TaxID=3154634 RepID=UPI003465BFBB
MRASKGDTRMRALAVCLVAAFMSGLDVSIVNVALPSIREGLGATEDGLQWTLSGYALTFGLLLVPAGRLGDARGRRTLFMWGVVLFTLSSAACGFAWSMQVLIAARLVQGLAAGMLNPQVSGLIQQMFRGHERGRAFGALGATIGVSTAAGPLIGGALVTAFGPEMGWRWVFLVNLPIGLALLPLAHRLLPRSTPSELHPSKAPAMESPAVGASAAATSAVATSAVGASVADTSARDTSARDTSARDASARDASVRDARVAGIRAPDAHAAGTRTPDARVTGAGDRTATGRGGGTAVRDGRRNESMDPVGVLLLGLGVACLLLPFIQQHQWHSQAKWLLVPAALLVLAAFVAWERVYRREPLVDLSLFRKRSYSLGSAIALFYFAGFTGIFFAFTLYLQSGLGYSPLMAGLSITPFALGTASASVVGGHLVSRAGRRLVAAGLATVLVGLSATMAATVLVPGHHVGLATALPLLIAGIGSGLVISPNQAITLSEVPPAGGGSAAGVLQTGQRLGSSVGIAAAGSTFFGSLAEGWPTAFRHGLLVVISFVVVALLAAAYDLIRTYRTTPQDQTAA